MKQENCTFFRNCMISQTRAQVKSGIKAFWNAQNFLQGGARYYKSSYLYENGSRNSKLIWRYSISISRGKEKENPFFHSVPTNKLVHLTSYCHMSDLPKINWQRSTNWFQVDKKVSEWQERHFLNISWKPSINGCWNKTYQNPIFLQ